MPWRPSWVSFYRFCLKSKILPFDSPVQANYAFLETPRQFSKALIHKSVLGYDDQIDRARQDVQSADDRADLPPHPNPAHCISDLSRDRYSSTEMTFLIERSRHEETVIPVLHSLIEHPLEIFMLQKSIDLTHKDALKDVGLSSQSLTALSAATSKDIASVVSGHTSTESTGMSSLDLAGLISSLCSHIKVSFQKA